MSWLFCRWSKGSDIFDDCGGQSGVLAVRCAVTQARSEFQPDDALLDILGTGLIIPILPGLSTFCRVQRHGFVHLRRAGRALLVGALPLHAFARKPLEPVRAATGDPGLFVRPSGVNGLPIFASRRPMVARSLGPASLVIAEELAGSSSWLRRGRHGEAVSMDEALQAMPFFRFLGPSPESKPWIQERMGRSKDYINR